MNVLHINHVHYIRGGAETFYFKTAELLEKHGHKSVFFSMHHPKNMPCETSEFFMPYVDLNIKHNIIGQLKIVGRILYSFEARRRLSKLLDKYPVDIAHLHNIYHSISPSILHELKKRRIPVVLTIHDPKLVCGSHNMYVYVNDNNSKVCKLCESCSGRKYYMSIVKRCVKESLAKSILVAMEMYLHHKVMDIYNLVDVFISPSLFFKDKFRKMGFEKEMIHLPYFIDIQELLEIKSKVDGDRQRQKELSVICFGRLSLEKGLFTLLKAAKRMLHEGRRMQVKIAGDGPIREQLHKNVETENIKNIKFLGYMSHDNLYQEVKNNIAAVVPSEWYDNYPMSIIETFAIGVPVIGARIGGIPEMVRDYETGLTFEPWNADDLYSKLKYLEEHPDEAVAWGKKGKKFVEQELNAEKHYQRLMEIYAKAIRKTIKE